jgi:hypothetical protein
VNKVQWRKMLLLSRAPVRACCVRVKLAGAACPSELAFAMDVRARRGQPGGREQPKREGESKQTADSGQRTGGLLEQSSVLGEK